MGRLSDWNIDLTDLEDQIEEALDEEYHRGRSEGFQEGADEYADALERTEKWDGVLEAANWTHKQYHDGRWPLRQCPDPLCRRLTELNEEVQG